MACNNTPVTAPNAVDGLEKDIADKVGAVTTPDQANVFDTCGAEALERYSTLKSKLGDALGTIEGYGSFRLDMPSFGSFSDKMSGIYDSVSGTFKGFNLKMLSVDRMYKSLDGMFDSLDPAAAMTAIDGFIERLKKMKLSLADADIDIASNLDQMKLPSSLTSSFSEALDSEIKVFQNIKETTSRMAFNFDADANLGCTDGVKSLVSARRNDVQSVTQGIAGIQSSLEEKKAYAKSLPNLTKDINLDSSTASSAVRKLGDNDLVRRIT